MSERVMAFGQPLLPDVDRLDDAAFLAAIRWRRRAGRELTTAASRGDVPVFARRLQRRLRGLRRLDGRICQSESAAVSAGSEANGRLAVAESLAELRQSLEEVRQAAADRRGRKLFRAWRSALVAGIELSRANGWPPADDSREEVASRVGELLRHGALPWMLGLLFADVSGAGQLRKSGRRVLRSELLQRTDGDGMPSAELLGCLPAWFSSLVRSAEWGEAQAQPLWTGKTRQRFERLTRSVATLCNRRGLPAAASSANGEASHGAFRAELRAAVRLTGWKKRRPAARLVHALANGAARRKPDLSGTHRPLHDAGTYPSSQSDEARLACLRTDWSAEADVLVLAHSSRLPEISLSIFGTPLLGGPWGIDVAIDGEPIELAGRWEAVCWSSDGDGDYLELQQRLANGLRIERQALLAREDRLLLLADAVSGAGEGQIEYTSRLPLVESTHARPDRPTRECRLQLGRLEARVFPLALPDDRVLSTPGSFGVAAAAPRTLEDSGALGRGNNVLELQQTSRGGLYAPLVLDWHPRRRRGRADWRTLTVAEDGRRVHAGEAGGHRLRIGSFQWLIYRSLTAGRPLRTVLGQHTANETLVGRFDTDGEVEAYVMVEAGD